MLPQLRLAAAAAASFSCETEVLAEAKAHIEGILRVTGHM